MTYAVNNMGKQIKSFFGIVLKKKFKIDFESNQTSLSWFMIQTHFLQYTV